MNSYSYSPWQRRPVHHCYPSIRGSFRHNCASISSRKCMSEYLSFYRQLAKSFTFWVCCRTTCGNQDHPNAPKPCTIHKTPCPNDHDQYLRSSSLSDLESNLLAGLVLWEDDGGTAGVWLLALTASGAGGGDLCWLGGVNLHVCDMC